MIKEKPEMKPNQVRISVIKKHEEKNKGNTSKWDEIVGDMGNNEMTTRNLRRTRMEAIGKQVINRDDFDPKPYLKNLEGGEKVIVIDSNDPKYLPMNFEKKLENHKKNGSLKTMSSVYTGPEGDLESPEDIDSTEVNPKETNSSQEETDETESDTTQPSKRLLIFTTWLLLMLCRFPKWSLDGTFKVKYLSCSFLTCSFNSYLLFILLQHFITGLSCALGTADGSDVQGGGLLDPCLLWTSS